MSFFLFCFLCIKVPSHFTHFALLLNRTVHWYQLTCCSGLSLVVNVSCPPSEERQILHLLQYKQYMEVGLYLLGWD